MAHTSRIIVTKFVLLRDADFGFFLGFFVYRRGPEIRLHNVLKADMEVPDGFLEEQGLDQCLSIAFNFLAGGRALESLGDTLTLIRKATLKSKKR